MQVRGLVLVFVAIVSLCAAVCPNPSPWYLVGKRVVRGPDWEWKDQDGGSGSLGVVVSEKGIATFSEPQEGWVDVEWASGETHSYRWNYLGNYDLRVIRDDGGVTDKEHNTKPEMVVGNNSKVPSPWSLVGKRVVRGPDWMWYDQDGGSGSEGVVVSDRGIATFSEPQEGWVDVEWASGKTHSYRWDHNGKYDLQLIGDDGSVTDKEHNTKPEMVVGDDTAADKKLSAGELIGKQVERGPAWMWDDNDGGKGSRGTVIKVLPNNWVRVEWSNGKIHRYRWGLGGEYDLRVIRDDGGVTDKEHNTKPEMVVGDDTAADKKLSAGELIGKLVVRGPDWEWDTQDGGSGSVGTVLGVPDYDDDWVSVTWANGKTHDYRWGHNGRYDLKIVSSEYTASKKLSRKELIGKRVVRGPDWEWADQN